MHFPLGVLWSLDLLQHSMFGLIVSRREFLGTTVGYARAALHRPNGPLSMATISWLVPPYHTAW